MTAWLYTAALGLVAAGWWTAAFRRETRLRLEAARRRTEEQAAAAALARIRARVAKIVMQPYRDQFGLLRCPRCAGLLETHPGMGAACSCPKAVRAA